MNNKLIEKFENILSKDFEKLTNDEAKELFSEDIQTEIHSLARVCRGMKRILMLEPCDWGWDFESWTEDDKQYSKKLLRFLLDTNGFQDIKP